LIFINIDLNKSGFYIIETAKEHFPDNIINSGSFFYGVNFTEQGDIKLDKNLAAARIEYALSIDKCPICRLQRESAEKYIWNLFYDTSDPEIHQEFKQTFGFCPEHNRLLIKIIKKRRSISSSSVARLYHKVVPQASRNLDDLSSITPIINNECPICKITENRVSLLIKTFLKLLKKSEYQEIYRDSDGLCLPHLEETLASFSFFASGKLKDFLIETEKRRLHQLEENLIKMQDKKSYDVKERVTREEAFSWQEAIWRLNGWEPESLLIKD